MKIRTDHARHRASRRGFARRPGFTVRFRQGFSLALGSARAAGSLLFGLKPYDAATMTLAVAILAAVALAASYLPAAHASKLDLMDALRHE